MEYKVIKISLMIIYYERKVNHMREQNKYKKSIDEKGNYGYNRDNRLKLKGGESYEV